MKRRPKQPSIIPALVPDWSSLRIWTQSQGGVTTKVMGRPMEPEFDRPAKRYTKAKPRARKGGKQKVVAKRRPADPVPTQMTFVIETAPSQLMTIKSLNGMAATPDERAMLAERKDLYPRWEGSLEERLAASRAAEKALAETPPVKAPKQPAKRKGA